MSLSDHTLADVDFHRTTRRYPRPIGWNAKIGPHGQNRDLIACVLTTDQGATGWGYCGENEEEIRQFIGRPISDLIDPDVGTPLEARCLDIALHDLAGKILDLPVWKMLGGKGGQTVPIYTGAIYFDDLNPNGDDIGLDAIIASCEQDAADGHAHFKLKIGRGFKWMDKEVGDARDVEVTKLVREHYPDAKILVDANDGYTPEGICTYLEKAASCDFYWVEEPFEETQQGLTLLRSTLDRVSPHTLVADGEARPAERTVDPPGPYGKWSGDHLEELYALCERNLIDVLLMDVGATGFTAWREIMPRLLAIGAQGSPHAWSEPFKSYYAAQIGGGYGGVPIVEGVPGHVDGVDASDYVIKDGLLTLPDTPGFGMNLCL